MSKFMLAAAAGFMLLAMTVYAGNSSRPKGTCGGYVDKNHNGFCDRSEKMKCKSKKCVASKSNKSNDEAWSGWKKDGKALEFPDQKKDSKDSSSLNPEDSDTAKVKLPCPGNCASCPMAGACI